jgi:hypothetical protein
MLVDRWEELGREHQLVKTVGYETGITHWTIYGAGCSCGDKYPELSASDGEVRNSAHLHELVHTHRELHHMKHLVALLLDEDNE